MRSRYGCVLALVVVIAAMYVAASRTRVTALASQHVGAGSPDCSVDPLCGIPTPSSSAQQEELNRFGAQLVQALAGHGTPGTDGYVEPEWEKWKTKCGVKIDCQTTPADDSQSSPEQPSADFFKEIEISTQSELARIRDGKPREQPIETAQLASVLYNPVAAEGIAIALKMKKKLPPDLDYTNISKMRAKSIIVKTIWSAIPEDQSTDDSQKYVFASNLTPACERVLFNAPCGNSEQLLATERYRIPLPAPGMESPDFTQFRPSPDHKCNPSTAPALSTAGEDCLHMYRHVPANEISAERDGALLNNTCGTHCTMALVGMQLMVRTREDAPWIWIALWWTGVRNGNCYLKQGAWNYYQIDVTNTPRTKRVGKVPNIVFNPFLEGINDLNGAVANCATCHSYAAYDVPLKAARLRAATEPARGAPPPPVGNVDTSVELTLPPNSDAAKLYLKHAIQTDFLWSLAGLGKSTVPTVEKTSVPNKER